MADSSSVVTIIRGDDTDAFSLRTYTIKLSGTTTAFANARATLSILNIQRTWTTEQVATKELTFTLSAAETATLPLGSINGLFRLIDASSKSLTIANTVPFYVTSQTGNLTNETVSYTFETEDATTIVIEFNVEGSSSGGAVTSVNEQTGAVVLDADDVDAVPNASGSSTLEWNDDGNLVLSSRLDAEGIDVASWNDIKVQGSGLDEELALKQDALSDTQLASANSGITAAKVSTYDGYASGKQDAIANTGILAGYGSGTVGPVTAGSGVSISQELYDCYKFNISSSYGSVIYCKTLPSSMTPVPAYTNKACTILNTYIDGVVNYDYAFWLYKGGALVEGAGTPTSISRGTTISSTISGTAGDLLKIGSEGTAVDSGKSADSILLNSGTQSIDNIHLQGGVSTTFQISSDGTFVFALGKNSSSDTEFKVNGQTVLAANPGGNTSDVFVIGFATVGTQTPTVTDGVADLSLLFSSANTSYDAANINYTNTGETTTTVKAKIQSIESAVGTAAASLSTALGTAAS